MDFDASNGFLTGDLAQPVSDRASHELKWSQRAEWARSSLIEVGKTLNYRRALPVVERGKLVAEPAMSKRKRYSLPELLKGSAGMKRLTAEAAWAQDGEPVGREIG